MRESQMDWLKVRRLCAAGESDGLAKSQEIEDSTKSDFAQRGSKNGNSPPPEGCRFAPAKRWGGCSSVPTMTFSSSKFEIPCIAAP